jgi:hypothetical protein
LCCLQVTKPAISIAAAAELVTSLWGGEVVGIAQLDSYDDQNFCVTMRASLVAGSTALRYALKVHNGVDSANLPFIEGQNAMMARVAEKCRYLHLYLLFADLCLRASSKPHEQ